MDEPLSNLDAALRVQTRADIVELQARLATTTLYVTHDQVEAMTMGHRIAVMSEGRLQQVATPEALYARPANAFVARFLGSPGMNLLEGMLVESGAPARAVVSTRRARTSPLRGLPGRVGAAAAPVADAVRGAGPDVVLGLRPEALHLSPDGPIAATVIIVELLGAETHVICHTENDARIIVRQGAERRAKPGLGEAVRIAIDPDPRAYHLFDATTGDRLGGCAVTAVTGARRRPGAATAAGAERARRAHGLRARRRKEAGLAYLLLVPAHGRSSASSPSIPSSATSS